MLKDRIKILDGFRAVAILLVLLYHFFTRYFPPHHPVSLYPYHDQHSYFRYGYLGVHFFFLISGFVISYTLETTTDFALFWKKRLIRLWPSLILATVITFLVFTLFDNNFIFPGSHSVINIIPSLTFINPEFFRKIYAGFKNIDYINGSYWSLWYEIQFYVFASIVFYHNKQKFIRNITLITFSGIVVHSFFMNVLGSNKLNINPENEIILVYVSWIQNIFNLIIYLPLFVTGSLFYSLFNSKLSNQKPSYYVFISAGLLMLYHINSVVHSDLKLAYVFIFGLFTCFVYYPGKLFLFENKLLIRIGLSSYFLYLIHEHIGLLIIYSFGSYFMPYGFILSLLLMITLVWLSILYTEKIESRITTCLKNLSR